MTALSHLIAAHIARHGVTRCPAAIVAPCSVDLSQADVEAHRERAPLVVRGEPGQFAIQQPKAENRRGWRR